MPSPDRIARKTRVMERAQALFVMYYQLGPERSLEKLHEVCAIVGLKLCLNTYKNYSVKYNWQRRVLETVVKERETKERDVLTQVDKMNEGHIGLSKGMGWMAAAGIAHYQERTEEKKAKGLKPTLDFTPGEIVSLARQSQIGERMARGLAINRTEIIVEVIGTFVQEFALIFKQVNIITDPIEREREYVRLFDERLREYYSKVTSQAVKQVQSGYEVRQEGGA